MIALARNSMLFMELSEENVLKISCAIGLKNWPKYVILKKITQTTRRKDREEGLKRVGWLMADMWNSLPFIKYLGYLS